MTPVIKWTEQLQLGIDEIDDQHFELITRVNRLIIAHHNDENKVVIEELLAFLKSYVIEHFGSEEHLQRQYHYPEYENHRKEHFSFVQMVVEFEHAFKNTHACSINGDCKNLLLDMNLKLSDWVVNHIGHSDRKMAEHILRIHKPNI